MAKPLVQDDRRAIAEKVMELGNLILVALAIGQLLALPKFNEMVAVFGIVLFIEAYFVAYMLMRGGEW